jgi:putative oxidoreductase
MEFLKVRSEPIYALTRIVVGFLFLCHGVQKFMAAAPPAEMPAPLFWAAAVIETFGGFGVMVGFFTHYAAFVTSGMMAVAYFMAHQPQALLPIQNKGELAALYSWVFLMLASRGSGIWSVDAARGRT